MTEFGQPASEPAAVVGAGIIGLAIAHRLAKAGRSVTIFDAGVAGSEASWAGAGMLAPGGEIDRGSHFAQLAIESRQLYPSFVHELESESGLPIDYQECGALDLAYSDEDWAELQTRLHAQAGFGLPFRLLNRKQIEAFWPRVRHEGLAGGLFYPGDAVVNPRELVSALKVICSRRGVVFRENSRVQTLEVSGSGVSVHAGNTIDRFAAAVVCAGAWSDQITTSGVPPLPRSEPVKGHLIGYRQPQQTCNTILRHRHTYLLQRANGLLIAGASMEHAGFNPAVDPERVAELAGRASQILPHLAETSPTEVWTGFRPGSDKLQLGRWHSPRLYLAYGHLRNGILLAPATAERIAQEINASLQTHPFVSPELPR